MDGSRDNDLAKLHGIFSDNCKPLRVRKLAHKSFISIQRQMHDRTLTKLRYQLVQAMKYGNRMQQSRLEDLISDYSRRNKYGAFQG